MRAATGAGGAHARSPGGAIMAARFAIFNTIVLKFDTSLVVNAGAET
ncbi:MAG: hypothetical protein LCH88_09235 [Proteobacteria bacterium]|nr:hypothetical protein [Pseudomonadota bacterium]